MVVIDRMIRAAGGAVLAAALVVAACSEQAPGPSRVITEEIGRVGVCHLSISSGEPAWTELDGQAWATHRTHRHDRAATRATCLSGTPRDRRRVSLPTPVP